MSKTGFNNYKISNEIKRAIEGLEFKTPTIVQERVIPLALENRDLFVAAQTGSGKTAAYAIPICEQIDWLENKAQVLVLTPTRELAVQVKEDFTDIGRFKRIKAAAIFGRHPFGLEKTELKQKTHVVAGTPGRVYDHIRKGTLNLSKIKYLVIDEADRMLDMGFLDQVEVILNELPKERVTFLFSATLPEAVKRIASSYMQAPIHIEVNGEGITTAEIKHLLYQTLEEEKLSLL